LPPEGGLVLVEATLSATDVETGTLTVEWDPTRADLLVGQARELLPAGSYDRGVRWEFRLDATPGPVQFTVRAVAGTLRQTATAVVVVASTQT
jgi:hypothetical protein